MSFATGPTPAEVLAEILAAEDVAEEREARLRRAVELLPLQERFVVRALYWKSQTVPQVATRLGITEKQATTVEARALKRLRRLLGE